MLYSRVFRLRSTRCLLLCHRKRCAPPAQNLSSSQKLCKILTRCQFNQIRCQAIRFNRIALKLGQDPGIP